MSNLLPATQGYKMSHPEDSLASDNRLAKESTGCNIL